MLAAPEGGCKIIEEKAASPTNLEKWCADKRKINMHTIQGSVDWWEQMHECIAPDETHRFVRINLDIIIYKTLEYLYLE